MWINVFPPDCDHMTVKPLLTAQRIRFDCDSDTGYNTRVVLELRLEMSKAFLSRIVLFFAVALLGTAHGIIQQSSECLFTDRKS